MILIDQSWLDSRGGIGYLDQAGETYVLQSDIVAERSAFAVIANDVTLDLNGHAVTYDTVGRGARRYGIFVGPQDWAASETPGFKRFGTGHRFRLISVVPGGRIEQVKASEWSHVVTRKRGESVVVDGVEMVVRGKCSSCISYNWGSTDETLNSRMISHVTEIENRHQLQGAVIDSAGIIRNCEVIGGPQVGIKNEKGTVENCVVRIKSRYTNGFGILGSRFIRNNLVDTTGTDTDGIEFGGRGIAPGSWAIVEGNTVRVREVARNAEYGGAVIGGAYGIQIEGAIGAKIRNNVVEAHAVDGVEAHALRLGGSGTLAEQVEITGNVFRAISDGKAGSFARCIRANRVPENTDLILANNTYETNDAIVLATDSHLKIRSSKIVDLGRHQWDGVRVAYEQDYSETKTHHTTVEFVDCDNVIDEPFRISRRYNHKTIADRATVAFVDSSIQPEPEPTPEPVTYRLVVRGSDGSEAELEDVLGRMMKGDQ